MVHVYVYLSTLVTLDIFGDLGSLSTSAVKDVWYNETAFTFYKYQNRSYNSELQLLTIWCLAAHSTGWSHKQPVIGPDPAQYGNTDWRVRVKILEFS